MQVKELKKRGQMLSPVVIIGKQGISEQTIEQISLNLEANKLTKIKFGPGFLDSTDVPKKELAESIATQTKSHLIQLVGNVVVLYKGRIDE